MTTTNRQTATERQLARMTGRQSSAHNDPFASKSRSAVPSATERQLAAVEETAERAARRARGRAHRAKVLAEEAAAEAEKYM